VELREGYQKESKISLCIPVHLRSVDLLLLKRQESGSIVVPEAKAKEKPEGIFS